jgi:hypothetical protein
MKFPSKVRVGAVYITCNEVDETDCQSPGIKNGAYAAYTDYQLKVEINKDMCEQQKAQSGVHELLHACFKQSGLTMLHDNKSEEEIVRRLEPLIYGLIRDNPQLVKYIQGAQ